MTLLIMCVSTFLYQTCNQIFIYENLSTNDIESTAHSPQPTHPHVSSEHPTSPRYDVRAGNGKSMAFIPIISSYYPSLGQAI